MIIGDFAHILPIFVRGAAFTYSAPLWFEGRVPARAKMLVAAMFAFALAPAGTPAPDTAAVLAHLPLEILFGLAAGFSARAILAAIDVGGELIGLSLGLGFAASYDRNLGNVSPVARIASVLGAFGFIAAGGFEVLIKLMALPPIDVFTLGATVADLATRSSDLLAIGLRFSGPVLLANLVCNVGLALASRAAPALNVFSVNLAALLIVGMLVLLGTAPAFAHELTVVARRAVESVPGALL